MPREEKKLVVDLLRKHFHEAEGVFLFNFEKVSVAEDRRFRRRLESLDVKVRVAKNTLIHRALEGTSFATLLDPFLRNPSLLLIVKTDLPRVARELKEILGSGEISITLKGGAIPGKGFGPEGIAELAALPTRGELVSRLALGLRSPIVTFTRTLSSPLYKLGYVLSALARKKEQSSQ